MQNDLFIQILIFMNNRKSIITGILLTIFFAGFISCESTKVGTMSSGNDAPLTGTYWKLTELMGQPVKNQAGNKEMHIVFSKDENRVSGFSGCNRFTGSFTTQEGNRLQFSQMAVTQMACINEMVTEKLFLEMLQKADSYSILGNDLSLNKARMAPLARFTVATKPN